jgi:hypothetical protein
MWQLRLSRNRHRREPTEMFSMRSVPKLFNEDGLARQRCAPRGSGLEYPYRDYARRWEQRKGNPVPGGVSGPSTPGGTSRGTWPSRLRSLESDTM